MVTTGTILFFCPRNAAKSVLAVAHFEAKGSTSPIIGLAA